MWPDRVSNPGPLTYESGALPTALRGPDKSSSQQNKVFSKIIVTEVKTIYKCEHFLNIHEYFVVSN